MNRKQIMGLIGALLIIAGVFVPVVNLPLIGNISLFNLEQSNAIVVLVAGAIGLVLAIMGKDKLQLLTSLVCFITIAVTSYKLSDRIGEFRSLFAGNSQHSYADSIENLNAIVHLSFGIPMIAVGALLLFFTAVSKNRS